MKKHFICLILLLGIICASGEVADAKQTEKIIFKADRITDVKQLEKRMDLHITDDNEFKADCILSTNKILDEGKNYKIKIESVKSTSQKIKEVEYANGNTESEYIANVFVTTSITTGSETTSEYDTDGLNAKLYVYINYTKGSINGNPTYKVNTVKGKIDKLDSSVSVTKMVINQYILGDAYRSWDPSSITSYVSYNNPTTKTKPSDNVYYFVDGYSPYYWCMNNGTYQYVTVTTKGYFVRGGSSWNAEVVWSRNQ